MRVRILTRSDTSYIPVKVVISNAADQAYVPLKATITSDRNDSMRFRVLALLGSNWVGKSYIQSVSNILDITPSYIQTVEERDREATFSWKLPVAPVAPIRLIAEIGQCTTNWVGNGGNPPATGTIITAESAIPNTSFHFETNFNPENVAQRATIVDLTAGTDFVYAIRHRTLYSPVVTSDYVVINLSTAASAEADIIAPKAPTNLASTAEVYFDRLRHYRSRLNYSWDKVTQNSNSSPITDLSYYELQVFEVDRFNQLLNVTLAPGVYTGQSFDNTLADVYGRHIGIHTSASSHTMTISGHRLGGLIVSNNIPVTSTHYSISDSIFADIDKYATTIVTGTTVIATSAKEFAVIDVTAGADPDSDTESYSFINAQPNVIYLARVRAIDTSDNKSPWTLINDIRGATDSTAPSIPSNIIAAATYHSVHVRWDRNIEEDLSGYELQRDKDGEGWLTVGHLVSNFYVDADVVPNSIYKYSVRAYDYADNYSDWSADSNSVTLLDLIDTSMMMDIINGMTTINLLKNSSYEVYNPSTLVPRHWNPVVYNQSTYSIQSAECLNQDLGGTYALLLHKKEATSGWIGVTQALTRIIGAGQTQTTRNTICTIANVTTYALHTKIYRSSTVNNANFVSLLLLTQNGTNPPVTEFIKTVQLSSCPILQWNSLVATGYVNNTAVTKAWVKILCGGPAGGVGPNYKLYIDNTMLQKGTRTQWVPYSDEFIFGDYAITEVEITNDAVIAPKIMANAVLAKHVRAGAIGANHIVVQNRHCELEGRFLADRQVKDLDKTSDDSGQIFRAGNIGMVGTGFKTITDIYSNQAAGGYTFLVNDASGIAAGDYIVINYLAPSEQPNTTFLTLNSQFAEVSVSDGGVSPGQITLWSPLALSVEADMHVAVVNKVNAYIAESDGVAGEDGWIGSYKTLQINPTNFTITPPTTEGYTRRWIKLIDNLDGTGTITLEDDVYADFNQDSLLVGSIDVYNQSQFPERVSSIRLIGGIGTTINGSQIDTYSINAIHLQSESIDVRHLQAEIIQAQHLDIGGFVPNDRAIVSYHFDTNVLPSNRIDGMLSFDQAQSSANWLIMYKDSSSKFDGYLKLGNVVANMMTITDSVFGSTSNWTTYIPTGSATFTKGITGVPHGISTYYKYERQYNTVGKIILGGVASAIYVISPQYNITAGYYYTGMIAIRAADLTGTITSPESHASLLLVWYNADGSQNSFLTTHAEQVGDWQTLKIGGIAPTGCTKAVIQVLVVNDAGPSYDNIVYFTHAWFGETTGTTFSKDQIYNFYNTDTGPIYLTYSGLTNTIRPKEGSISFWGRPSFAGSGLTVGGFIDVGNTSYGSGGASDKIGLYFIKRATVPKWNLVFMNGSSSVTITEADTTLNPWMVADIWAHIAITWKESDYLRLYVDGILVAEKAIPTLASNQWYSDNLVLGAMSSSLTSVVDLDELLLYDYQIDAEEVKALYYANGPSLHRNTSIDADSMRTGALYSVDYRPNFAGWIVDFNGDVEFNSGTFRGSVVIEGGATIRNGATIEGTAVVDGDALIDGTVTANKLVVSGSNLALNGSFETFQEAAKTRIIANTIPYWYDDSGTDIDIVRISDTHAKYGNYSLEIRNSATTTTNGLTNKIPVDPTQTDIMVSVWMYIPTGMGIVPRLAVKTYTENGTQVLNTYVAGSLSILDGWQLVQYHITTAGNIYTVRAQLQSPDDNYSTWFDGLMVNYGTGVLDYDDGGSTYIDPRGIVTDSIQSRNYSVAATGWSINTNGAVDFNTGNFRGDVVIGGTATIQNTVTIHGDAIVGVVRSADSSAVLNLDDNYFRIASSANDVTTFNASGMSRKYYGIQLVGTTKVYTHFRLQQGVGGPDPWRLDNYGLYGASTTISLGQLGISDHANWHLENVGAQIVGHIQNLTNPAIYRVNYRPIAPRYDYTYTNFPSGDWPAIELRYLGTDGHDYPTFNTGFGDVEVQVGSNTGGLISVRAQFIWAPLGTPVGDSSTFIEEYPVAPPGLTPSVPMFGDDPAFATTYLGTPETWNLYTDLHLWAEFSYSRP